MIEMLRTLAWALPLVLLIGLGIALALRRVLSPDSAAGPARARARLRESLEVSDDTRVYVIEVDRKSYLLVESVMQTSLHSTQAPTNAIAQTPNRAGSPWLVRLCRGEAR